MMQKSKKYAVTGGIGSGKSQFCAILREEGANVFSCDEINAELWQDPEYLSALAQLFPDCTTNKIPDKSKLSALVFADDRALKKLNEFSHKEIIKRLYERMSQHSVSFAEVPLLFESGLEGDFDGIIVLMRDKKERIQAVMQRDKLTESDVLARINRQYSYENMQNDGYILVENNRSVDDLRQKAKAILRKLN